MDPLTISVNDVVSISEVRFPVAYVVSAWSYSYNNPIAYASIDHLDGKTSSSVYLASNIFFNGQSFTGDGRYLRHAMFTIYTSNLTPPLPSTAKIYAKLYSHSGTYGTSSVPGSLLKTSTNYITTGEISSGAQYWDVVFYFDGLQQLVNGTKYVIGLYCNEITSGVASTIYGNAPDSYFSGNGCTTSSGGAHTARATDMPFVVGGPTNTSTKYDWLGDHFRLSVPSISERFAYFSPDGLNIYYLADGSYRVHQYKLSVPWNPQSGTYWGVGPAISSSIAPTMTMSIDGLHAYFATASNVLHYTLSSPFDVTSSTLQSNNRIGPTYTTSQTLITGIAISTNGKKLFVSHTGEPNLFIREYDVPTAFYTGGVGTGVNRSQLFVNSITNNALGALYGGSGTNEVFCQSYIPSTNITIGRVVLYGHDYGGIMTDSIYVEVATSISGAAIATSSLIYPGQRTSGYYDYFIAFFDGGLSLSSGQEYFFRIIRSGARSTTTFYYVPRSSSTVAAFNGGKAYVRNSGVWSEITNSSLDMLIEDGYHAPSSFLFQPAIQIITSGEKNGGKPSSVKTTGLSFSPDGTKMAIFSKWATRTQETTTFNRMKIHIFTLATPWSLSTATAAADSTVVFPLTKNDGGITQNSHVGGSISPNGKYITFADNTSYIDFLTVGGLEQNINDQSILSESITTNNETGGVNVSSVLSLSSLLTNSDFVEMFTVTDGLSVTSLASESTVTIPDISVSDSVLSSEKIGSVDGSLTFNRGIYRVGGVPNYVSVKNKTGGTTGAAKTTRGGNMSNRSTLSGGTV